MTVFPTIVNLVWVKGRRGARNGHQAPVSTCAAKRVRTNYFKIHFKISHLRNMVRSVGEAKAEVVTLPLL